MANTHLLKTHVEPHVRHWLSEQYSQAFSASSFSLQVVVAFMSLTLSLLTRG